MAGEFYGVAESYFYAGNLDQASRWIDITDKIFLDERDDIRHMTCLNLKFNLALAQSAEEQALRILEQEQEFSQEMNSTELAALLLYQRGLLARLGGDMSRAVKLLQDSLDLAQINHFPELVVMAAKELGNLALAGDDLPEAHRFYFQALCEGYETWIHDYKDLPFAGIAILAVQEGQVDRAAHLFGAAHRFCRGLVNVLPAPDRLQFESHLAKVRDSLGEERFEQLFQQGRAMSIERAVAYALGDRNR